MKKVKVKPITRYKIDINLYTSQRIRTYIDNRYGDRKKKKNVMTDVESNNINLIKLIIQKEQLIPLKILIINVLSYCLDILNL